MTSQIYIKGLDSLDIDLNEILAWLKTITLNLGFDAVNAVELRQISPPKSLHDFVNERGIEDLEAQSRRVIDEIHVASHTLIQLMIGFT